MTEITKMLQARVPEELVQRLDNWRLMQGLPVLSRAEAVRRLLERALDDEPVK